MCQPLRLTTLWASTACYSDSFTPTSQETHSISIIKTHWLTLSREVLADNCGNQMKLIHTQCVMLSQVVHLAITGLYSVSASSFYVCRANYNRMEYNDGLSRHVIQVTLTAFISASIFNKHKLKPHIYRWMEDLSHTHVTTGALQLLSKVKTPYS
jgi:hypothetical protein